MPVPALPTPTATPATQPAATRANPMSPASANPLGAAPPQQPTVVAPPVGGITQPNLPTNQQAQKVAALKKAELYSVLYRFGVRTKKANRV